MDSFDLALVLATETKYISPALSCAVKDAIGQI